LKGQVALVTGGARRVGAAIARRLAVGGAAVAVHYNTAAREAVELVGELRAGGGSAWALHADLTDPEAIARLFGALDERAGPVALLVNNAAIYEPQPLAALDAPTWDRTLHTNLRAPLLCIREAVPRMHGVGRGAVVNVSDLAGLQAWPGHAHHVASKAGLIALTRSLARELHPTVRVNAVAPGLILRADSISAERWAELERRVPAGHAGTPADVAEAVWLLADCEAFQGVVLPVDGGRLVGSRSKRSSGP